jgi:hypothetical protein
LAWKLGGALVVICNLPRKHSTTVTIEGVPYPTHPAVSDLIHEISKERDKLKGAVPNRQACDEVKDLCIEIYEQHYEEEFSAFEVCDSIDGVISQIDNMVTGIVERAEKAEAEVDKLRDTPWINRAISAEKVVFSALMWSESVLVPGDIGLSLEELYRATNEYQKPKED